MAIEDALEVIVNEWRDIEPLLTVSELAELASISRVTMRGGGSGRSAAVFGAVAPALPADHAAWSAYRAQHGFDPEQLAAQLDVVLIDLAASALADPSVVVDAAADALAEQNREALLSLGAVAAAQQAGDSESWLSLRVGDQLFYPSFQFIPGEPVRQCEMVARLREQLAADEDPAGAAAWWLTPNPWLSATPADLLGTEREPEIAYAADQLANDSW